VEHRPTCVTTPLPGLNSGTRAACTSTKPHAEKGSACSDKGSLQDLMRQLAKLTCMHHTMSQTSVGNHTARTSTTQGYHGRHQPGHVLSWHMTHDSKHDFWIMPHTPALHNVDDVADENDKHYASNIFVRCCVSLLCRWVMAHNLTYCLISSSHATPSHASMLAISWACIAPRQMLHGLHHGRASNSRPCSAGSSTMMRCEPILEGEHHLILRCPEDCRPHPT
jgi:hypothetical protein